VQENNYLNLPRCFTISIVKRIETALKKIRTLGDPRGSAV
jgi:hypothetical protein